jgi:hypothetical protein
VRKRQFADIIWAGFWTCLISDPVLRLFQTEGVTGFDAYPADARLMFPHEPNEATYWQISVSGWGGFVHPDSGIHQVFDPTRAGKLLYSPCTNPETIIDTSQWDGSDFFIVWPLPMYWWISPKVVGLLEKHRLKRYEMAPPADLRFGSPVADNIGFMPGRLRHYFEDERARLIGESLGIY